MDGGEKDRCLWGEIFKLAYDVQTCCDTFPVCECNYFYGQQATGNWNPFKLVIIKSDTAILDTSLYSGRDSMVAEQQRQYYQAVKGLEEQVNCTDCPKDTSFTKELRDQLAWLRSMENEAKQFRCHHILFLLFQGGLYLLF